MASLSGLDTGLRESQPLGTPSPGLNGAFENAAIANRTVARQNNMTPEQATEQMRQWWKEECQNGTYRPYILKKDGYFCIVRLVFTPEDEQLCIDIAERAEMNKRNQSQVVSVREGDLLVMDGFGDLVRRIGMRAIVAQAGRP